MANYAQALDRVQQQAERNYANREEGDGAIQGVFNGILNQLNQDLDPNNVDKKWEPWCKEKDWILFSRYAGSRFKIDGGELRILNDDEVLAVIDDTSHLVHT